MRNTQDVDLLVRRADFEAVKQALTTAGFSHRHAAGMELFLDGADAKARDALHVFFAGEKVRPEYTQPAPDASQSLIVSQSNGTGQFRVIQLEPLVGMKLTSYRIKDRMHLLDLISVGLIDATWPARFAPELSARLQELLDHPDA